MGNNFVLQVWQEWSNVLKLFLNKLARFTLAETKVYYLPLSLELISVEYFNYLICQQKLRLAKKCLLKPNGLAYYTPNSCTTLVIDRLGIHQTSNDNLAINREVRVP